MENPIHLYTSDDGHVRLQVALEQETVWLTQAQMAELFDKDVRTINEHIGNIYGEDELTRAATIRKFRIVRQEGKRQVNRELEHYNLDVIISVGYRVKSRRGVQFRQWATQTLRQHLVQGYTLHEKRLQERGIEIGQALALLQQTLANQSLVNAEGAAVLAVLQGYDEQNLAAITARQHDMRPLAFEDVLAALAELKTALIAKGEATELFGQLRGDGLASAIATIEQGFGDSYFYPNIASRAAHRLYFVIKNHPLADGNKRSGAFLFLWYLRLNAPLLGKPVEQLITDNTLVALALLVAESLTRKRTSLSALSNTSSRYARDKSCFRTQKNRRRFLGRFFYGICY